MSDTSSGTGTGTQQVEGAPGDRDPDRSPDGRSIREGPASYLLIRDLPTAERPRERLARYGPEQLTTAELLAIIWRTGSSGRERESAVTIASRALAEFHGLAGLARASLTELERIKGVGPVKAIELRAALELGRRYATMQPEERPVVRRPADVYTLLHSEMASLEREHLRVVLLNSKNHVLAVREIYRGTLTSSSVRVAELFREAIRENCASLIIVHNHPSGDPTPSPEDVRVTAEAVKAGQLLDIEVLDHIIIGNGRDRYISLKERGLGFS
jgi:DNA repair protein RadC